MAGVGVKVEEREEGKEKRLGIRKQVSSVRILLSHATPSGRSMPLSIALCLSTSLTPYFLKLVSSGSFYCIILYLLVFYYLSVRLIFSVYVPCPGTQRDYKFQEYTYRFKVENTWTAPMAEPVCPGLQHTA